jgi:hypothetical protein
MHGTIFLPLFRPFPFPRVVAGVLRHVQEHPRQTSDQCWTRTVLPVLQSFFNYVSRRHHNSQHWDLRARVADSFAQINESLFGEGGRNPAAPAAPVLGMGPDAIATARYAHYSALLIYVFIILT